MSAYRKSLRLPDTPAVRKSLAENEAVAIEGVESGIPPLIPKEASPQKKVIAPPEPPRRKEAPHTVAHPAPHLPAAGKQTDIPSCYL